MRGNFMHGNREVPCSTGEIEPGLHRESERRKSMMNEHGKSEAQ